MSTLSGPTQPPGAGTLAERQAALVRALVVGAAAPAGFDADAVGAAADAVLSKRAGEVARRFPSLAHACDGDFTAAFTTWAREHPKTTTPADAAAFAAAKGIDWSTAPRRGRWRQRRAAALLDFYQRRFHRGL
ncbi:hypothetical protein IU459_26290 [Nocardia amamiensis]|uniref:SCO6045-like C-terminal domain-containing protein n=1 Tax=Nocardia amamiensis TaxID=404578 RepID=A0ABS0CWQ7_9NOCA|nr:hypothetical protein [Nocardia amamiensis]MBF6301028.1 hypothetical protein [Nocardia amamiensis]